MNLQKNKKINVFRGVLVSFISHFCCGWRISGLIYLSVTLVSIVQIVSGLRVDRQLAEDDVGCVKKRTICNPKMKNLRSLEYFEFPHVINSLEYLERERFGNHRRQLCNASSMLQNRISHFCKSRARLLQTDSVFKSLYP
jgi:hypothetical protein